MTPRVQVALLVGVLATIFSGSMITVIWLAFQVGWWVLPPAIGLAAGIVAYVVDLITERQNG